MATTTSTTTTEQQHTKAPREITLLAKPVAPDGENRFVDLLATVLSPDQSTKTGHDICIVLDVSGSTINAATPSLVGTAEDDQISILDIVKHAAYMVISSADSNTTVSIVPFSSQGHVALESTTMDEAGQTKGREAIARLVSSGSTNLWGGIKLGVESLPPADPTRTSTVLVLTDGEPNNHPVHGYVPTLQRFRDTHGANTTIHTFGFGYSLDSALLNSLSTEGDGSFFYIPDANYVGTTFIHTLSSILCTEAESVQLAWELGDGVRVATDDESYTLPHTATSWGVQHSVGVLQAGQSRSIVLRVENTKGLPLAQLATVTADGGATLVASRGATTAEGQAVASTINRQIMVTQTRNAAAHADLRGDYPSAQRIVAQMIPLFRSDELMHDAATLRLIEDISGQVTQAVASREFFQKWGRHYLRSLIGAHDVQQCINFKDPGMQGYGGVAFRDQRDRIETVFEGLPPPVPSRGSSNMFRGGGGGGGGRGGASAPTGAAVNVGQNYYNRSAPCAKGSCPVRMADGSYRPIAQLRKGDWVQCAAHDLTATAADARLAQITCVVQTRVPSKQHPLVALSRTVSTTAWHPVRLAPSKEWTFPKDAYEPTLQACRSLYSLVAHAADGSVCPAIWLDTTAFITLAHGLESNNVVKHPFLGTSAVIDALQQHSGWADGKIVFSDTNCMLRDSSTGLACGFGASE